MTNIPKHAIDYEPHPVARRRRIARRIQLACYILFALGAGLVIRHLWNRMPGSNASWTYPSRVGVDAAMRCIRDATTEYMNANGVLPSTPKELTSYLSVSHPSKFEVTPTQLLPHTMIMPASDPTTKMIAGKNGRFVLAVYLNRSGGMRWDVAVVVPEDKAAINSGLYFDDDLMNNFGTRVSAQLKKNAFQLP